MPDCQQPARIHLQQIDELPCLRIHHPNATALIALQGAQVLEFTPTGSQPVIWLSECAGFRQGQSVRGGIPICWPWFGDLQKNPLAVQQTVQADNAPAHGWVRNQPWLLEQVRCDECAVSLRLRYPAPMGLGSAWAQRIALTLDVTISDSLSLKLTTTNYSNQALTLSQALHSYFAVSHIDNVQVLDLEQVRYIDTLRDWQAGVDRDPLLVRQEIDRIYLDTPPTLRIRDNGWQRTLHIHCEQSRSAVVWNPWIDKAKRLGQFADDAYQRMLCIETARVMDDVLALAPGDTHTMAVSIQAVPDQ